MTFLNTVTSLVIDIAVFSVRNTFQTQKVREELETQSFPLCPASSDCLLSLPAVDLPLLTAISFCIVIRTCPSDKPITLPTRHTK